MFRARHLELGRTSAVKIVPGALGDEQRRRRFMRELEALGRLSHPGIVRLHAAFPVPWGLACEMELIEGESLDARLARDGPLPWREAAGLVAELARAVGHAHAAGVLHRDLKPANVLLRADGRPVLADLGLSRLADQRSSLTTAGAVIGTPLYMPLEGLRGQLDGPAVDVYGLGAVLHAALTGEPPVNADSLPALARALDAGPAPLQRRDLPPQLDAVRLRALQREPADRHPSAEALATDLEAVLAGRAPSSAAGHARLLLAARRRWPWAAGALLLVALLATPLVLIGQGRPGSAPAPEDPLARSVAQVAEGRDPQGLVLRRLLSACQEEESRAGLREALAALGPELPAALRLVRATLEGAEGRPPALADLAALAVLPPGPEAEALLERARGLDPGSPGLLEATQRIHEAHPDWQAAALARAEVCLRHGGPALRQEARRALEQVRSPRAGRIRAALSAVDVLIEALSRSGDTLGPTGGSVAEALSALDAPELLPGVTAPLGPTMWRTMAQGGLLVAGSARETGELLAPFADHLDPALVVLIDMARTDPMEGKFHTRAEPLQRAASALRATQPILAAWAETRVVELTLPAVRRDQLDELSRLASQAEAALQLLGSVETSGMHRNEEAFVRLASRRTAAAAAEALLWRSQALPPPERGPVCARALRSAQVALEVSKEVGIKKWLEHDARVLVLLLAELDRLEESEPVLPFFPRAGAVRAELARRSGRAAEALELAERALAEEERPLWPAVHAARALALADLGRPAEARAVLEELRQAEAGPWGPAPRGFGAREVEAHLAARAR